MQFDAEPAQAHAITAYSAAGIVVGGHLHTGCLIIDSAGLLQAWQVQNAQAALAEQDLAVLANCARQGIALGEQAQSTDQADTRYEVILLGTGRTAQFPPVQWLAPFASQGWPLEVMGTAAACRTYNIVASEGRKVLAALWQPF